MKNPKIQRYVNVLIFYIDNFLLQNAVIAFYNLYYDIWDLITKFWPGSTKWNTPFNNILIDSEIDKLKIKNIGLSYYFLLTEEYRVEFKDSQFDL